MPTLKCAFKQTVTNWPTLRYDLVYRFCKYRLDQTIDLVIISDISVNISRFISYPTC